MIQSVMTIHSRLPSFTKRTMMDIAFFSWVMDGGIATYVIW